MSPINPIHVQKYLGAPIKMPLELPDEEFEASVDVNQSLSKQRKNHH